MAEISPCVDAEHCDEAIDACICLSNNECDDNLYCNGVETCSAARSCQAGNPIECDDGVGCTSDSCNEDTDSCENIADDAICDNGVFCDGIESCNALTDCQPGEPINCDDGLSCTVDTCDEGGASCVHQPDNTVCDNDQWCDGMETCDPIADCQPGTPPCPPELCDEETDQCPCDTGESCVDFLYRCVIVGTPTDTDRSPVLPSGMTSVYSGQPLFVELWVTDSGETNTGIISAYADLEFPPDLVRCEAIEHTALFSQFLDGSCAGASLVDELGGSQLSPNVGIAPEWARVAYSEFSAVAAGAAQFTVQPARNESSAYNRGLIPPSAIEYDTCEVVVSKPALIASKPECDISLTRPAYNLIELTFDAPIPNPVLAGEIEIRELKKDGGFGADISAQFTFIVEDEHVLQIAENGIPAFANETWYGIMNTGGWADVQEFSVNYRVVPGDANNSGFTNFADLSFINANFADPTSANDLNDINASGFVNFADLSAAYSFNGATAPPKPNGHVCTP